MKDVTANEPYSYDSSYYNGHKIRICAICLRSGITDIFELVGSLAQGFDSS